MSQRKTRTMATDSPPPYHWLARQNRIPTWNLLVKCCRFLWNLLNIRCTLIIIIDMRMAIMSYRDWPLFHAMNNFRLFWWRHTTDIWWEMVVIFFSIVIAILSTTIPLYFPQYNQLINIYLKMFFYVQ